MGRSVGLGCSGRPHLGQGFTVAKQWRNVATYVQRHGCGARPVAWGASAPGRSSARGRRPPRAGARRGRCRRCPTTCSRTGSVSRPPTTTSVSGCRSCPTAPGRPTRRATARRIGAAALRWPLGRAAAGRVPHHRRAARPVQRGGEPRSVVPRRMAERLPRAQRPRRAHRAAPPPAGPARIWSIRTVRSRGYLLEQAPHAG